MHSTSNTVEPLQLERGNSPLAFDNPDVESFLNLMNVNEPDRFRIRHTKSKEILKRFAQYSGLTIWVTLTVRDQSSPSRQAYNQSYPASQGYSGVKTEVSYTLFLTKLQSFYDEAKLICNGGMLVPEVGKINNRRHAHGLFKIQKQNFFRLANLLEKWDTFNGFYKAEPINTTVEQAVGTYISKYLYKAYTEDTERYFGGIPPIYEW